MGWKLKYFPFFSSLSPQSPPKGATIPYRPKPQVNGPVILANGQAYTIQGNFALPAQEVSVGERVCFSVFKEKKTDIPVFPAFLNFCL